MNYRFAAASDAETIARIHIAGWQTAYRGILPDDFLNALDLSQRTEAWRQRLLAGETLISLAVENDVACGFCSCGRSRDANAGIGDWEIQSLYIAPSRRGAGIGRGLFDRAMALGRQRGATQIMLWVAEQNQRARRFYEAHGMQADGASASYVAAPGIEMLRVRYRLVLASSDK